MKDLTQGGPLNAVCKSGIFEHRGAIKMRSAEHQVEPEEISCVFAKAHDVGGHKIIVVGVPKWSPKRQIFCGSLKNNVHRNPRNSSSPESTGGKIPNCA